MYDVCVAILHGEMRDATAQIQVHFRMKVKILTLSVKGGYAIKKTESPPIQSHIFCNQGRSPDPSDMLSPTLYIFARDRGVHPNVWSLEGTCEGLSINGLSQRSRSVSLVNPTVCSLTCLLHTAPHKYRVV